MGAERLKYSYFKGLNIRLRYFKEIKCSPVGRSTEKEFGFFFE